MIRYYSEDADIDHSMRLCKALIAFMTIQEKTNAHRLVQDSKGANNRNVVQDVPLNVQKGSSSNF